VHGTFTDGGARPNIVPERAALLFYLRSAARETLRNLADRVVDVAGGAAAITGCGVELHWDDYPPYLPVRSNHALAPHTTEFAAASGSESGDRAVRDGAFGLALTAVDYLADAELREAVHAEFAAAGGPLDVPRYFD
jgi:metal-dependent amidase/aminoacylase/carboxypeptidase family protein